MTARIYAHPTATGEDMHRLYREHRLVAISKPTKVRRRQAFVLELKPLARPSWLASVQQVSR
jgi:hypothetical protein